MEEQLISFETAKLAKEKGFKDYTSNDNWYDCKGELKNDNIFTTRNDYPAEPNECDASTQSLLQKWLREEYEVIVWLIPAVDDFTCFVSNKYPSSEEGKIIYTSYESGKWEDVLEIGLQEALKSLS